jgi:hypothetical protein
MLLYVVKRTVATKELQFRSPSEVVAPRNVQIWPILDRLRVVFGALLLRDAIGPR